jgi:hypothetical protein
MTSLNLGGNSLTGGLPSAMSTLTALVYVAYRSNIVFQLASVLLVPCFVANIPALSSHSNSPQVPERNEEPAVQFTANGTVCAISTLVSALGVTPVQSAGCTLYLLQRCCGCFGRRSSSLSCMLDFLRCTHSVLDVSNNKLSSTLPSALSAMSNLLYVAGCCFRFACCTVLLLRILSVLRYSIPVGSPSSNRTRFPVPCQPCCRR